MGPETPDARYERISPAATRSLHDTAVAVDAALIRAKARDARANARKREIHIFHTGDEDTLQRMLNALQPGTYITPHRHVAPPKAESILVLQGRVGFATFHDDGSDDADHWLCMDPRAGVHGVDYRGGVWHTFFALEPDTVILEAKPGPYAPATDKEFAPWAPEEGAAQATAYLADIEDRFRAMWGLADRPWSPQSL